MRKLFVRFLRDESGATALEYGLIAALIFLAIVTSLSAFGHVVGDIFNTVMNAVGAAIG